jgi:hypothetical protein
MTISTLVAAALEASAKAEVNEHPGSLTVEGKFSKKALEAWREVARACPAAGCSLVCRDSINDARDLVSTDLTELAPLKLRIVLDIAQPDHVAQLATVSGLTRLLATPDALDGLSIIRLLGAEPVVTLGPAIEPWTSDGAAISAPKTRYPTPRRFARTVAGEVRPPAKIEPWIIEGDLDRSDVAFLAWRDAAALAIARSLVSEVYQADGKAQVVLAGKPTRRIAFGDLTIEATGFSMLQQAARWIFVEGPDAELRHTFLVHELARAWEGEEDFGSGLVKRLPQALESASLTYRAHVQDGSRETIKCLADMRKTLAEEIAKVTQQTRDLAAGLWRDVAVAIVTIAFRFSMDAAKGIEARPVFSIIFILVAFYVAISQTVAVSSNRAFLKVAEQARDEWRLMGYAYLSDKEFAKLAGTPLREARAVYDRVERTANRVAAVVSVGLLGVAAHELGLLSLLVNWLTSFCSCN